MPVLLILIALILAAFVGFTNPAVVVMLILALVWIVAIALVD